MSCCSAISVSSDIWPGMPQCGLSRWLGFVRDLFQNTFGSMFPLSSQSARIGIMPPRKRGLAVAKNGYAGIMTIIMGERQRRSTIEYRALVPLQQTTACSSSNSCLRPFSTSLEDTPVVIDGNIFAKFFKYCRQSLCEIAGLLVLRLIVLLH